MLTLTIGLLCINLRFGIQETLLVLHPWTLALAFSVPASLTSNTSTYISLSEGSPWSLPLGRECQGLAVLGADLNQ